MVLQLEPENHDRALSHYAAESDGTYRSTSISNTEAHDEKDEHEQRPVDLGKDFEAGNKYLSAFSPELRTKWTNLVKQFLINYTILSVFMLGVFSVYWGSLYKRLDRIKDLKMLVVIEDDREVDDIPPVIGTNLENLLGTPEAQVLGDWHIYHSDEFNKIAQSHNNNSIEQEIHRQVHHQNYWTSIYVRPNASYNYYQAIINGDLSYNVSNLSILSIYETGRDFIAMETYITPSVQEVQQIWLNQISNVTSTLASKIEGTLSADSIKVLTTPLTFTFVDNIPFLDPVIIAPAQVGLIYIIIITVVQAAFFTDVHKQVASFGLNPKTFLFYRWFSAMISFFVVSAFFSLVSLAMQIDFTKAFGHSGFLVYWMASFLTMCAVGLANEIMSMVFLMIYPPAIGLWMLFWVIINIAATFSPIALCPNFFRYGYGLPIHNAFEIYKVVFFNTWKGTLGRSFGVIVAWVVLMSLLLPVVTVIFGKTMKKRAMAALNQQIT